MPDINDLLKLDHFLNHFVSENNTLIVYCSKNGSMKIAEKDSCFFKNRYFNYSLFNNIETIEGD